MPSARTKAKAIKTLEGLIEIATNEQVRHVGYISDNVNPELRHQGAICGGHSACLIGSTWLANGQQPVEYGLDGYTVLRGVHSEDRAEFMRRRPALQLALGALDQAAERRRLRDASTRENADSWSGPWREGGAAEEAYQRVPGLRAEALFEGNEWPPGKVVGLARSALKIVEAS